MGLLEHVPGMGRALKEARQAGANVDESQFKRIEAIIHSMTPGERRSPDIIGGSRRKRIAQGSGTSTSDINQLLTQFREMQKMMKMLTGGGGGGMPRLPLGLPGSMPAAVQRTPRRHAKAKRRKR